MAQLNAVRWDLDGDGTSAELISYAAAFPNAASGMGCPTSGGCTGYELSGDLDFDTGAAGDRTDDDYHNGGDGWLPIGGDSNEFTATFDGNGHTVANLLINRSSDQYVGLFGAIAAGSEVRNVGLRDVDVRGSQFVGGLVGSDKGAISGSYATGAVTGGDQLGGLAGLVDTVDGKVTRSYADVAVTGTGSSVGGLVGFNRGGAVTASYSTGPVSSTSNTAVVGGLAGWNTGSVTASFSTGAVSASADNVGGLIGLNRVGNRFDGTVTDSYWDTGSSGQPASDGGTAKTGAELRAPTGYTGIYAAWNLDLDNDANTDDNPWDFGAAHNYPTLNNVGGKQQGPGPVQSLTADTLTVRRARVSWTAPA